MDHASQLCGFKHDVLAMRDALCAWTYAAANDSAVAYARAAARDPNFSADFIDDRRSGDLLSITTTYGGLA